MSSFAEKQKRIKEKAAQEAIYEATIQLIAAHHDETLKMQDIADKAGIATGTLYNYFKNKVELLCFVDHQLHSVILERLSHVADFSGDPREKLKKNICEMLGFCKDYHGVFDLTERLGIKDRVPTAEKLKNLTLARDCIQRILDEGVQQNVFESADTTVTAELFFATIIGTIEIQNWIKDYDMSKHIEKLTNFFLTYLQKQDS